jgi:hypothetical protein
MIPHSSTIHSRSRRVPQHQAAMVLSSTIFVVVQCASIEAQDLSRLANNPLTTLEGPLQVNDIETSGLNAMMIQQVTQANSKSILPIDSLLPLGPMRIALSATATTVYNDNIYFSARQKTSDEVATVTPHILLSNGEFHGQQETWLVVEYAPQYSRFYHHTSNDSFDQNATLNFEWRPASWTFGVKQLYQTSSGPVDEAAARTNRTIYFSSLYAKYDYSPKTNFELHLDQYLTEFDHPYFGETKRSGTLRANYEITPKIELSLESLVGFADVSEGRQQSFQDEALEANYVISPKSTLHARAGLDIHEFQTGVADRYDPIFSVEFRYNYSANTFIQLDAYRREEDSIVAANQNYLLTGAAMEFTEGFLNRFHFGFAAGINHSDYYPTTLGATGQDSYNYFFLRPALGCQVGSLSALEVFYQYQENWSSPVNAFRNNIFGVDVGVHF